MCISEKQVEKLRKERRPVNGWVNIENGWFYAPDGFAQTTAFITEEFESFSRQSRSRWSLFEYFRNLFNRRMKIT